MKQIFFFFLVFSGMKTDASKVTSFTHNPPASSISNLLSCRAITPLQLISFSATETRLGIELNWQINHEKDLLEFEIERSTDGERFKTLENIASNGPTSTNSYTFTDALPLSGTSYYRLKIIRKGGIASYSEPEKITHSRLMRKLSIYPVPAQSSIHIKTEQKGVASFFSSNGRLVKKVTLSAGSTEIDISSLDKGLYYCELNGKMVSFIKSPH